MSVGTAPPAPLYAAQAGFHRWSVADYHRFIELGILTEDDRVELLEGNVVVKMAHNPPHDVAVQRLTKRFVRLAPIGWEVRIQLAITLANSEPEPDAVLARGDEGAFTHRRPLPADIGVIVEVSASSLAMDRADKGRIYAQAGLPIYWIVNVIDRQIEVYTDPQPGNAVPGYSMRTVYNLGDAVPLILDRNLVARLPVNEILG